MDRAESLYENGLPLHVANPEESIIKFIPDSEWSKMTDQQKQLEKDKKNVVVTNSQQREKIAFDEDGIMAVGGMMSRQISINGERRQRSMCVSKLIDPFIRLFCRSRQRLRTHHCQRNPSRHLG